MTVYLKNATRRKEPSPTRVTADLERLLEAVGEVHSSVSVSFVGDTAMRKLNKEFRGKDAATDVLSFPLYGAPAQAPSPEGALKSMRPERLLGDIVVSLDTASRQAAQYDATLENEVRRLLIHGLLHLLGHDHERDDERIAMEREERRLAEAIALPWPYE